ncbi:unnamed protein product [Urochloa humidicola]
MLQSENKLPELPLQMYKMAAALSFAVGEGGVCASGSSFSSGVDRPSATTGTTQTSTGLGRDPLTGCITATDDWWAEQNAAMPGCISFKNSVLEHEDMMRIMFEAISVTNETSYVPGGGHRGADGDGVQEEAEDSDGEGVQERGTPEVPPSGRITGSPYGKKRPNPSSGRITGSPSGKKRKTYRDNLMKRLVDTYEKKAQSSTNSATSVVVDHVREEIGTML